MTGADDWQQRLIGNPTDQNHMVVWIHRPCGALIWVEGTSAHSRVCPANAVQA